MGVLGRSFGLGMDSLKRIRLVTADGEVRDVQRYSCSQEEQDLFWAIPGGSPGSWGAVLEYEFEPIHDADYPHSRYLRWIFAFNPIIFQEAFHLLNDLYQNPIFKAEPDISVYFITISSLADPNDSATHLTNVISIGLFWTGIKNGDMSGLMPGSDKSWYDEFAKPFQDLHDKWAPFSILNLDTPMPVSQILVFQAASEESVPVAPFRYYNHHATYKADEFDQLMDNRVAFEADVNAVLSEIGSNNTDNVEVLFQWYSLLVPIGSWNDGCTVSENALDNCNSYPGRAAVVEADNWVLFGNQGQYEEIPRARAEQLSQDLENIFTEKYVNAPWKSFSYSDMTPEEYDEAGGLETFAHDFYFGQLDVYNKLKQVKAMWDPTNVFKGPLTVPPACQGACGADTVCDLDLGVCVADCESAAKHSCCSPTKASCGESNNVFSKCVCLFDPWCCDVNWDGQCISEAVDRCDLEC